MPNQQALAGQDTIQWRVSKINAVQKHRTVLRVRRSFDVEAEADFISVGSMPTVTGAPKQDEAYDYLLAKIEAANGLPLKRQALMTAAKNDLDIGERVIANALNHLNHDSRIRVEEMGVEEVISKNL